MTVRPNFEKWDQKADEIWRMSIEAEHPRSRERFQAIYQIGTKQSNSRQWAEKTKRRPHTVLGWVHSYNEYGPDKLYYQRSGGRQLKLAEAEKKR